MSDCTIYPADTVDSVGENISDCKIYPADTVDIYGNVWSTVGENIRNGLFGRKIKTGKISINNGKITSQDLEISNVANTQFSIEKHVLLLFPISCSTGYISLRFSLASNNKTLVTSFFSLESVVGEAGVIYTEV